MMMYPMLSSVSTQDNHEIVGKKVATSSLEERCEVIQFIAVKLEILLHARDVGIVLHVRSDLAHKDGVC